jgi:hypothetical protein
MRILHKKRSRIESLVATVLLTTTAWVLLVAGIFFYVPIQFPTSWSTWLLLLCLLPFCYFIARKELATTSESANVKEDVQGHPVNDDNDIIGDQWKAPQKQEVESPPHA